SCSATTSGHCWCSAWHCLPRLVTLPLTFQEIRRIACALHGSMLRTICRHARPLSRGVLRSIGQSAAPCQKQNGALRGALWCVSGGVSPHSTRRRLPGG